MIDLEEAATTFCAELQLTLDAVLPRAPDADPEARKVTARLAKRAFIVEVGFPRHRKNTPIPLLSGTNPVANFRLSIFLVTDHAGTYPAVESSSFELLDGRHPVVRLDYRRDMHTAPSSHWNVHAERTAITRMVLMNRPDHSGELSALHLPNGGERMRPCLEDFLEFLVVEVGVTPVPGWEVAVRAGRERWRRRQLAALVRDMPEVAAAVLRDQVGYDVEFPGGGDPPVGDRRDRTLWFW